MAVVDADSLFGRPRNVAVAVAIVLGLAAIPPTWTAYYTRIVFIAIVIAILGISWNLLAGYAGQISLGHAAFFGIGAFVSAWLTSPDLADLPGWLQVPMPVSLLGGALAAGLVALVIGPAIFRLTGHYFAIGTLALATIVQLVLLDAREFSGGSTGLYLEESMVASGVYYLGLGSAVLVFLATYWIVNSASGLGMRAIHGDETAASSLGVNPLKYKLYAFGVTSAMAGLAGGLYAQFTLYVNPETTLAVEWMIETLVVVIVGGMGSMVGPVIGTAVFFVLDNTLPAVVGLVNPQLTGSVSTAIEGLLIVLIVVFAPQGVYGFLRDAVAGEDAGATEDGDEAGDVGDDSAAIERPRPDQSE